MQKTSNILSKVILSVTLEFEIACLKLIAICPSSRMSGNPKHGKHVLVLVMVPENYFNGSGELCLELAFIHIELNYHNRDDISNPKKIPHSVS